MDLTFKIVDKSVIASTRFSVTKLQYEFVFLSPDIELVFNDILGHLKNQELETNIDLYKLGISVLTKSQAGIHIELKPFNQLSGEFILNRLAKFQQSDLINFDLNSSVRIIFTLFKRK